MTGPSAAGGGRNDIELAGRVIVVTGGAGGIGSATAARLADAGAHVVVVDRDAEQAAAVAADIAASGGSALDLGVDVRHTDAPTRIVEHVAGRFGALHALVNIAGFFPGDEGPLGGDMPRHWDLTMDVNLRSVAALCAQAAPHLVAAGGGAIVNTSSTQARAADVAWTSYGVAKAGVESLTRYLATQYGRAGVRCNCVAPGLTATPNAVRRLPDVTAAAILAQTPLGRMGRPEEIAEVVLFLVSERSSFVTGQVLAVDGGMTCHMPTLR